MRDLKRLPIQRRSLLLGAAVVAASPALATAAPPARYRITLLSASPPRFAVHAELPTAGRDLSMFDSYPAELPQMAARGWPALISELVVRDASGAALATAQIDNGWRLPGAPTGPVTLDYVVDLGVFAAAGWSSPLESVIAGDGVMSVIGRALFIGPGHAGPVEVDFVLPAPWRAVAPWAARGGTRFAVRDQAELIDNMLVFSTTPPIVAQAAGFTLQITAMGHWRPLGGALKRALTRIIAAETALMGWTRREVYNVVLLPVADTGGEAYRQSFAYCFTDPTVANAPAWANTLAHEIFHYWNYARLKGADYASTQWFQEGFTEYVANLVLMTGKVASPSVFLGKLSKHIENAAKLTTTLENIGTRKGPPLYSAGALVAFSWDVAIRRATAGRRDIGAFFRNLLRVTGDGARRYAWSDIRGALEATAPGAWEEFHQRHIKGDERLPIEASLAMAGLKLEAGVVSIDPNADPAGKAAWRDLQTP